MISILSVNSSRCRPSVLIVEKRAQYMTTRAIAFSMYWMYAYIQMTRTTVALFCSNSNSSISGSRGEHSTDPKQWSYFFIVNVHSRSQCILDSSIFGIQISSAYISLRIVQWQISFGHRHQLLNETLKTIVSTLLYAHRLMDYLFAHTLVKHTSHSQTSTQISEFENVYRSNPKWVLKYSAFHLKREREKRSSKVSFFRSFQVEIIVLWFCFVVGFGQTKMNLWKLFVGFNRVFQSYTFLLSLRISHDWLFCGFYRTHLVWPLCFGVIFRCGSIGITCEVWCAS